MSAEQVQVTLLDTMLQDLMEARQREDAGEDDVHGDALEAVQWAVPPEPNWRLVGSQA